ncbi:helix-turn-helix domain-containing protein [Peterkaempfera sp. SMS 1(5)a]|uniref:helix-turn-helix domain-containing protein n=1 Tax=Peterkaempfera podocarpi TaxID=3232308 RepID=UPI00366FED59
MANPNQDGRDGWGRYTRTLEAAQRRANALELRSHGLTYDQIAEHLGISKSAAFETVQQGLADTVAEPAAAARKLELDRLDVLYQAAMRVLEAQHLTVSHGKVVQHDGAPLEDDGPVLNAIDRLVRISERRARLLGLDAPNRVSVDAEKLGAEILTLLTNNAPDSDPGDDGDA